MRILLFGMPSVSLGSQSGWEMPPAVLCRSLTTAPLAPSNLLHVHAQASQTYKGFLLSMLHYFYIHRPTSALVKNMAVCLDA